MKSFLVNGGAPFASLRRVLSAPVLNLPPLVAALIAALAFALTLGVSAAQAQNIDTRPLVDNRVGFFGIAQPNFGQTITIPPGQNRITSYSIASYDVPSTFTFESVVMAWDGVKATGPILYRSTMRSTTGATRQNIAFTPTTPITVTPGAVYVLILSAGNGTGTGTGTLDRALNDAAYPGGALYFTRGGPAEAEWTKPWTLSQGDLGFTTDFAYVAPAPIPTMSEWAMILLSLTLAGGAVLYIERRRKLPMTERRRP